MIREPRSASPAARAGRPVPSRRWWLALTLVVALAAAFRLVALDRYPPGLHYDEAAYGLQGLELLEHPRLQLFFPAFTGREPLFIYLLAAAIDLLGPSVWTIRAVAALVGTAAVLTTALVGRAMFGRRVGLLGAALLAVSFWHVTISRMTYRAGLVAALTPLAIWLIWRLWQRPGPLRAILAGGALGLLAYTYVAIRLLPFALMLFAVGELAAGPLRHRRRLAAVAVAALVAAATAAPLGVYFLRHPDDFGVRFAQTVSLGTGDEAPAAPILRGIGATLGMYGLRGDALEKYNLPLRPALDPVLTALFVLGAARLLARVRRTQARLLLAWLLGTLAPGFITADSPNFLRLIGAAPPSYLIAALGLATGLGLVRRLTRAGSTLGRRPALALPHAVVGAGSPLGRLSVAALLALALVSAESLLTLRDYFVRWAPSAVTYYALHGDMADLGRLAAASPADATTYVASEHYRHPTVAFVAGAAFDRLRWFDGRDALVLPPPGHAADYLIPRSARPRDVTPLGQPIARVLDPDGQVAVERLSLPASEPAGAVASLPARSAAPQGAIPTPAPSPPMPTTGATPIAVLFARRGGPPLAELLAAAPAPSVRAGQTLPISTTWRLLADSPAGPLDLFVHAVDAGRRRWGQRDASPYLSDQWRPGETLVAWLDVPLDATAPPGPYRLRIGLNDPSAPGTLELRRPDGAPLGADLLLAPFAVIHAADLGPPPADAAAVDLGGVSLSAAPPPPRLTVGEAAWIDLRWRASADAPSGSAELLLRPAPGSTSAPRSLGARDLARLDPAAPWRAGETIDDARLLRPRAADAGRWTLAVRMGDREQPLGPIEVALPAAVFDAPHPGVPVDASLGDVARLLGLDLTPGGVRLYWQASAPSDAPLTVFVHALDPSGQIVAQHDGTPAGGQRPTTGWIPDEIVVDDHPIALPPGWSALAIGLYDPTTGRRLPLPDGADHVTVQR